MKYGANVNFANAVGDSAATWAASLGRFDLVGHLLELGYSNNLGHLAAMVQARHVPKDSEAQRLKDRVIDMLHARGLQYPVQQSQTLLADFKAGRKQEADDVLREVLTSNPSKAGPLATPNGLVDTLPIGTKIFICTLRFSPLAERN